MKRVAFAAAIVAFSASVFAQDMLYRADGLSVRLTQGECSIPPLSVVLSANGAKTEPKAALVVMGSREIRACWAIDEDGDVMVADETGRGGFIPMTSFKQAPGA